jgi:hypothetical protein
LVSSLRLMMYMNDDIFEKCERTIAWNGWVAVLAVAQLRNALTWEGEM